MSPAPSKSAYSIVRLGVVMWALTLPTRAHAQLAPATAMTQSMRGGLAATGDEASELADPGAAYRAPFPLSLELAIDTHAPLSLGGEIGVGFWDAIFLRLHAGVLVGPYTDLINTVGAGAGLYDATAASIVSGLANGTWILRPTFALRPVPGYGFEVSGGYTMIELSAALSAAQFQAASGQSWSGLTLPVDSIGLRARLHAVHAQLGWSGLAFGHLVVRGGVGWTQVVASEGGAEMPETVRTAAAGRVEAFEASFRAILVKYGMFPTLDLAVGYRF
jgi:hypothetical protein